MNRVFFFSYRNKKGPVGGSAGVNFRIYQANISHRLIENSYFVFADAIVESAKVESDFIRGISANNSRAKRLIKRLFGSNSILLIVNKMKQIQRAKKWMRRVHAKYKFTPNDICVFHDFESALAFRAINVGNKSAFVYHQQGSLYAEWSSFTGRKSEGFRKYLQKKLDQSIASAEIIVFPSKGALVSLLESEPILERTIRKKEMFIIYNCFNKPHQANISEQIKPLLEMLQGFRDYRFITVSALNYAKGVEQIPELLSKLKKKGIEFVWLVIGDGALSNELEQNINAFGLKHRVIWLKEKIEHEDLLVLFENTDFYVMLHRYSIFDFATIEAMGCGNIPVLSAVGGNLEFQIDNNSILINAEKDIDELSLLLNSKNNEIEQLKRKNVDIQRECFSEEVFLKRYYELSLRLAQLNKESVEN